MRSAIVRTDAVTRNEENGGCVIDALKDFAERSIESHMNVPQRMPQRSRPFPRVCEVGGIVELPEIVSRRMRLRKHHQKKIPIFPAPGATSQPPFSLPRRQEALMKTLKSDGGTMPTCYDPQRDNVRIVFPIPVSACRG